LIAAGLAMGIGKRELFRDYYLDEIFVILQEYARLKAPAGEDEEETQYVYADDFM